jgi:hypothetical protein
VAAGQIRRTGSIEATDNHEGTKGTKVYTTTRRIPCFNSGTLKFTSNPARINTFSHARAQLAMDDQQRAYRVGDQNIQLERQR